MVIRQGFEEINSNVRRLSKELAECQAIVGTELFGMHSAIGYSLVPDSWIRAI